MSGADGDPIEDYLDSLLSRLRGTAGDVRRALAESEAHLRDAAEAAAVRGEDAETAAHTAIARFGSPPLVAASFNRQAVPCATRQVLASVAAAFVQLGTVGLLAVGVSGAGAWGLSRAFGDNAVFGGAPGTGQSASSCAHFLAVQPGAHTCARAALLEGRDDAIFQRLLAGILGLLLVAGWLAWRRLRPSHGTRFPLPSWVTPSIGVTAFGAAALVLAGYGLDRARIGSGSGEWFAAAVPALLVAVGYALRARRAALDALGGGIVPG